MRRSACAYVLTAPVQSFCTGAAYANTGRGTDTHIPWSGGTVLGADEHADAADVGAGKPARFADCGHDPVLRARHPHRTSRESRTCH
eukprot:824428-Rhodomonas_salina.4